MADTMRLNAANANSYVSNYTTTAAAPAGCVQTTAGDATVELACWHLAAYNAMPIGSQAIIAVLNGEYTVTLRPYDRTNDALGNPISYSFFL